MIDAGRKRCCVLVAAAGIGGFALAPARAAETVYDYHIEHPRYGDIGTYRNVIKQDGNGSEISTELRIAVKFLGIVVYRENANRTEEWQDGRLVRFDGVTDTNGSRIELHGEAKGDQFVMRTPNGTITAPANVHPSNPWAQTVLDTNMMMSAKTGRVEKVSVTGPADANVTFDGKDLRLKQYEIDGDKRQFVWFDDRGVPFAMRTVEDGSQVDFVLTHASAGAPEQHAQN
ncbi:MAG TPA: DUF6134 family protein [Stellaceae bacterium]|nr:DUF6134 family protein [Stellaceae bacterium]